MRIIKTTRHLPAFERGSPFTITVDGKEIIAYPGETLAGALTASGIKVLNYADDGSPRGIYCGIGQCFSCLVTVDGQPGIRACMTLATPGMRIQTNLKDDA